MSHDGAEWKCRDVLKDPFGGDDQQTRKLPAGFRVQGLLCQPGGAVDSALG